MTTNDMKCSMLVPQIFGVFDCSTIKTCGKETAILRVQSRQAAVMGPPLGCCVNARESLPGGLDWRPLFPSGHAT